MYIWTQSQICRTEISILQLHRCHRLVNWNYFLIVVNLKDTDSWINFISFSRCCGIWFRVTRLCTHVMTIQKHTESPKESFPFVHVHVQSLRARKQCPRPQTTNSTVNHVELEDVNFFSQKYFLHAKKKETPEKQKTFRQILNPVTNSIFHCLGPVRGSCSAELGERETLFTISRTLTMLQACRHTHVQT